MRFGAQVPATDDCLEVILRLLARWVGSLNHEMNKGLYALAGVIFALVVSSIIGPFFSGLAIGLVIGYSICDKGEMLTAVWMKLHPHIDVVFARLFLLARLEPEDDHEYPGHVLDEERTGKGGDMPKLRKPTARAG